MIWQNIFLSYISLFALGLGDNIRGPVYPEILNTFHLSNGLGSMMFALSSFMSLIGGLQAPWLMQRWNLYKILSFGLISMTVGLAIMTTSTNFWIFLTGTSFFGYSFGPLGIAQNALLVQGTNPHTRVRWMAGLHSLYGLASFTAPLVVAAVATLESPWRWGFGITGGVVLIASLVSTFLKTPKSPVSFSSQKDSYGFTLAELHMTVVFAFYVTAELLVGTRLAQYMRTEFNYDLRQSSLAVTVFYLGMLTGRILFIIFKVPWHLKGAMLTSLGLTLLCLCLGLWVHPYFLIATGFTMGPFYAWAMTYVAEVFHLTTARAIALVISADALFLVFMHAGVGQLTDAYGIWWAMLLAPILIAISILSLVTFKGKLHVPDPDRVPVTRGT